jgi:thiol-disulfide isomerase/thioredoxin
MKKFSIIICFLLLNFFISAGAESASEAQVVVYYFHTTFRCPTCYKIEQYTQEAVEQYFNKEILAGTLVFKTINFDEKENKHYIKDYQLFSKAVVISMIKEGKEVKFNNLTKIWEYVRDKEKFCQYIKTETAQYLEGIN